MHLSSKQLNICISAPHTSAWPDTSRNGNVWLLEFQLAHVDKINRIHDGVEAETRKSQASFQII